MRSRSPDRHNAGIAHDQFAGVSAELIDELQEALGDEWLNEKRRGQISELMDTLRGNLEKVVQHGKRADAIVKNMLLSLARRLRRASARRYQRVSRRVSTLPITGEKLGGGYACS